MDYSKNDRTGRGLPLYHGRTFFFFTERGCTACSSTTITLCSNSLFLLDYQFNKIKKRDLTICMEYLSVDLYGPRILLVRGSGGANFPHQQDLLLLPQLLLLLPQLLLLLP